MGCGRSLSLSSGTNLPWGVRGTVRLKSVKYKATYSSGTNSIEEAYPRNIVTLSELSWEGRTLTLTDTMSIDMAKGVSYELPRLALVFKVGTDDSFLGVQNIEELVSQVEADQQVKLTRTKRDILVKKFTNECKEFWQMTRAVWRRPEVLRTETVQFSRPCCKLELVKKSTPKALEDYVRKAYSVRTIHKTAREYQARATIEVNAERTLTVGVSICSVIHVDTYEGPIIEVQRILKNMQFCWNDIPDLRSQENLQSEAEAFNAAADRMKLSLEADISKLRANSSD